MALSLRKSFLKESYLQDLLDPSKRDSNPIPSVSTTLINHLPYDVYFFLSRHMKRGTLLMYFFVEFNDIYLNFVIFFMGNI